MMCSFKSLFCSVLVFTIFKLDPSEAAPVTTEDRSQALHPRQDLTVEALTAALPGINWGFAFTEFTSTQIEHLRRAFTDVYDLAFYSDPTPQGNDPSFLAYFGSGYLGARGQFFYRIFNNLRLAGQFPLDGNGQSGQANQITIRSKDLANRCELRPEFPGYSLMAYTAPQYGDQQPSPFIVLCPSFFDKVEQGLLPHLYDLVNQAPTTNIRNLLTQEHVLLHELMHTISTFFTSAPDDVVDVATTLPGETDDPSLPGGISKVKVYGPVRCKKLAASKSPSSLVRVNADNYAWFATSYFFSHQWGIGVTTLEVDDVSLANSVDYESSTLLICDDNQGGDGDEPVGCVLQDEIPTCEEDSTTSTTSCVL